MKHCPQCDTGYPDSHTTCPTHGVPLNEIRDLKPGMVVHHSYRIVRKLGQGGMGAVYLAQHTLMDEPRALKFLSSELSGDREYTARFLREVRTLRQLRHRNVVDCGDLEAAEDGSLFFAMEFIDGPNLRDFLRDAPKPFDIPLALSIARGIAEGLGAAHSKGIVHRDIKPENILIVGEDNTWLPKIADFGCVAIKETNSALTRTRGAPMTMAYAAPEQWRGTPAAELDGRTDLYALGGVLYWMLTGQTVFKALNEWDWVLQHMNTQPSLPSTLRPELANWQGLDTLVLRLLAKDREDRPKDVAELVGLIDTCLIEMKSAEERRRKEREAKEWLRKGLELQKAAPTIPTDPNGPKAPVNPHANPATTIGVFLITKELADQAVAKLEKQLAVMEQEFHILHGSQKRTTASWQFIENLYNQIDATEKQIAAIRARVGPEELAKVEFTNMDLPGQQKVDFATLLEYIKQVLAGTNPDVAAKNLVMTPEDQEMAHVAHFIGADTIAEAAKKEEEDRREYIVRKRREMLEEAFKCFEKGYELDPLNTELLYWLADSYEWGNGIFKDEEKAVTLYQRAADMGHAEAQRAIGDAYAQSGFTCLPKDEKEAAKWYQAAAEQGNEEAVCMIVDMYQHGEGVKQDHAEAARLLRNAAARGDETARHNLRLYAKQYGAPYEEGDRESCA